MDSSTLDAWQAVEALLLMPWDLDVVPKRTAGSRLALLAEEAVFLHPNGEPHQMNAAAGLLLAAVDGQASVRTIIGSVAEANRVPLEEVARYLPGAYSRFQQIGALQAPPGTSAASDETTVVPSTGEPATDEVEPVGTFAPDGRSLPPVDT